jgi:hypothetical protein
MAMTAVATWPQRLQKAPYGPFRDTKAAMTESDLRIGKSLGLDVDSASAGRSISKQPPTSGYSVEGAEPPVRIELTTFRLQGECSTTELRRPGKPGASLSVTRRCR